jgi:hypothetical protein
LLLSDPDLARIPLVRFWLVNSAAFTAWGSTSIDSITLNRQNLSHEIQIEIAKLVIYIQRANHLLTIPINPTTREGLPARSLHRLKLHPLMRLLYKLNRHKNKIKGSFCTNAERNDQKTRTNQHSFSSCRSNHSVTRSMQGYSSYVG